MGSESQRQTRHRAIRQIEAFTSGPVNRSSDRKVCQALHRGVSWGVSLGPESCELARTSAHSPHHDYTIFLGFFGTPTCMGERGGLKFGT